MTLKTGPSFHSHPKHIQGEKTPEQKPKRSRSASRDCGLSMLIKHHDITSESGKFKLENKINKK